MIAVSLHVVGAGWVVPTNGRWPDKRKRDAIGYARRAVETGVALAAVVWSSVAVDGVPVRPAPDADALVAVLHPGARRASALAASRLGDGWRDASRVANPAMGGGIRAKLDRFHAALKRAASKGADLAALEVLAADLGGRIGLTRDASNVAAAQAFAVANRGASVPYSSDKRAIDSALNATILAAGQGKRGAELARVATAKLGGLYDGAPDYLVALVERAERDAVGRLSAETIAWGNATIGAPRVSNPGKLAEGARAAGRATGRALKGARALAKRAAPTFRVAVVYGRKGTKAAAAGVKRAAPHVKRAGRKVAAGVRAGVKAARETNPAGDDRVRLPSGRLVPGERCPCGDGSCMECDDRGMRPADRSASLGSDKLGDVARALDREAAKLRAAWMRSRGRDDFEAYHAASVKAHNAHGAWLAAMRAEAGSL